MTRIVDQINIDFDWWGVDRAGRIGHFTTGGNVELPETVGCSDEDHEEVWRYFIEEAPTLGRARLPEGLEKKVTLVWHARIDDENSFRLWKDMAAKGCYSYDLNQMSDEFYEVRAIPERPLLLEELPENIRRIVARTVLQGIDFANLCDVPVSLTLKS